MNRLMLVAVPIALLTGGCVARVVAPAPRGVIDPAAPPPAAVVTPQPVYVTPVPVYAQPAVAYPQPTYYVPQPAPALFGLAAATRRPRVCIF